MDENVKQEIDMGIVKISDEVVGVIAGLATTEVKGVVGMSTGVVGGITQILTGKKNLAKGVKVNVGDSNATIDLYLVVEYGLRIPDIAVQVQDNVRKAVETMTGLTVAAVNVHVQNVFFPKNAENLEQDAE